MRTLACLRALFGPAAAAVVLLHGCGGGEAPPPPPAATQKAPTAPGGSKAGAAPGGSKTATPAPAPGGQAPPAGAPAATPALPEPPRFTYDPRGRRDPFRPLIVARTTGVRPKTGLASLFPEEIKLTGIVWDPKGYYALVEAPNGLGYVVRTNDILGEDARVTRITPEGMVLEMPEPTDIPRPGSSNRRVLEIKLRKEEDR